MNKLAVFLLILITLLQYRLWFGDGNLLELHRLNDHIEELRRDGDRRQERNAALEAEVMDLKQGTEAIEERARQDLGMIKAGEVFVQVIEHRSADTPSAELEPSKTGEHPQKRKRRARKAHPSPKADSVPKETESPREAPLEPE